MNSNLNNDWFIKNCDLHNVDCLILNPLLLKDCRLLYIDPPYGPKGEDKFYGMGDNLEEYIELLVSRLKHLTSYMVDFNIVVHVDWKCGHYVKVEMDKLFGRKNFKNEIVWGYSGPSVCKKHFPRKHDVLYWYGVGNNVFNTCRIPYNAKLKVGGKTGWSSDKDTSEYLQRGKLIEDWWIDIPALVRNEKEKRGYKTQKPKKLLDRLMLSLSNEGDLVCDPMLGSGTTLLSAHANNRKFIGCDNSLEAIQLCRSLISS